MSDQDHKTIQEFCSEITRQAKNMKWLFYIMVVLCLGMVGVGTSNITRSVSNSIKYDHLEMQVRDIDGAYVSKDMFNHLVRTFPALVDHMEAILVMDDEDKRQQLEDAIQLYQELWNKTMYDPDLRRSRGGPSSPSKSTTK